MGEPVAARSGVVDAVGDGVGMAGGDLGHRGVVRVVHHGGGRIEPVHRRPPALHQAGRVQRRQRLGRCHLAQDDVGDIARQHAGADEDQNRHHQQGGDSDGGAAQRCQVRSSPQRRAPVGGECPDVGARRTGQRHGGPGPVPGAEAGQLQALDADRARLPGHGQPFPGQFVQAPPIHPHRRHHGRDLLDLADEGGRRRTGAGLGQIRHVPGLDDTAGGVARVGGSAEDDRGLVRLAERGDVAEQPRGPPHTEDQHTGGVGIQRAGVAHLADAEQAP